MNNDTKKLSDAAAMAQFRLALIAPVIHDLYPDASRNAYYRRVTENSLTLPDGSVFRYSPKTLSKWVSLYLVLVYKCGQEKLNNLYYQVNR